MSKTIKKDKYTPIITIVIFLSIIAFLVFGLKWESHNANKHIRARRVSLSINCETACINGFLVNTWGTGNTGYAVHTLDTLTHKPIRCK